MSLSALSSILKELNLKDKIHDEMHHYQRILIFGKDGQVGKSLQKLFSELQLPGIFIGKVECNLLDELAIEALLKHYQPQFIVNAAAYTAVDMAQTEIEKAFKVNAKAVQVMAHYIAKVEKGVLIHFSTDYVFDGLKATPYNEEDATRPLSAYGQSKLAGEHAIEKEFQEFRVSRVSRVSRELREFQESRVPPVSQEFKIQALLRQNGNISSANSRYYILRTSWVYGKGKNFIRTMLTLASQKDTLRVIKDQVGCPTSSDWLGQVAIQLLFSQVESGVYHAVVDGQTSWYELALFAIEVARLSDQGKIAIKVASENIYPILATQYPLPAPRPNNSSMHNQKLKEALKLTPFSGEFPHWQEQVENYVKNEALPQLKN